MVRKYKSFDIVNRSLSTVLTGKIPDLCDLIMFSIYHKTETTLEAEKCSISSSYG